MTAAQREHYEACLKNGCSEGLAEMLALQQTPAIMTDAVFLEGRGGCYDQFRGNHELGNLYSGMAKEHGVDTTGKVYLSSLAAFPGDPQAWVSGRGDVRRVCEERGWGCEGAVSLPVTKVAEPSTGKYEVAADIVEDRLAEALESLPQAELPHLDLGDLREQVKESLTPAWAK